MAFLSTVLRSVVCFMIIKGVLGDPIQKIKNGPIGCFRTLNLIYYYTLFGLEEQLAVFNTEKSFYNI